MLKVRCDSSSPLLIAALAASRGVVRVGSGADDPPPEVVLVDGPRLEATDAGCPVVSVLDLDGRAMWRSPALSADTDAVAVRLVLATSPDEPPREVVGRVGRRSDAEATLAAVLAVVPALVRQALAQPLGTRAAPPHEPSGGVSDSQPSRRRGPHWLRSFVHWLLVCYDWRVGVLTTPGIDAILACPGAPLAPVWARARWDRYWADPSPVQDSAGRLWIFVEEFLWWRGRGRIVALRWDGGVAERRVVLDDGYHRALPRARLVNGTWLATVDTCQVQAPVFTFAEPGEPWTQLAEAMLPPYLADPELLAEGEGWTVVGTNAGLDEDAACETWRSPLGLPFAWTRDDSVGYVDVRLGRGGGGIDRSRDVRMVQDCARIYGRAVTAVPASRPPFPSDAEYARWDGSTVVGWRPTGMHTMAWTPDGSVVVIDGWTRRLHPMAWWWRSRELRRCRERSDE